MLQSCDPMIEVAKGKFRGQIMSILVVDDDALVREATCCILNQAGHVVVQAGSAEEALDCIEKAPAEIDILVADYSLPGMDGIELAKKVLAEGSVDKVLVISGRASIPLDETESQGVVEFLHKPFNMSKLLGKIDHLLGLGEN